MQGLPNATSTGYIQPMGAPMFSPHSSMVNASQNGYQNVPQAFQPFDAGNGFPMAGQPVPPFNGSVAYPPMQGPTFAPTFNQMGPAFGPAPLMAQNFNSVIDNVRHSLLSSSAANIFPQTGVMTSMIQPQGDFQITETVVNAPRRSITRIFRPSASYRTTETTFVPAVSTVETVLPQIRRSIGYTTVTPLLAPTITTERVIRRSVSSYRTSPVRVSVSRQVYPVTETFIEPMVSSVYVPTTTVTYPARSSVVSTSTSYVETGSFM
jgi:hypothetical protein